MGLEPKVQNIVATAAIGGNIDLHLVASKLPKLTFEPEQFPGAIYRTPEGPCIREISNLWRNI